MRCTALRRDGEQCRAHAVGGGERCARHRSAGSGEPSPAEARGGKRHAETGRRSRSGVRQVEHTDGPPAYYATALDAEEFDAYLQALGLESLRDEAALIGAKVRARLGGEGDERRELPLLLRAIEVLVRVVQADRAASRGASGQAQDLAHVVEVVLADLDSGTEKEEGETRTLVADGGMSNDYEGEGCPPLSGADSDVTSGIALDETASGGAHGE